MDWSLASPVKFVFATPVFLTRRAAYSQNSSSGPWLATNHQSRQRLRSSENFGVYSTLPHCVNIHRWLNTRESHLDDSASHVGMIFLT